MNIKNELEGKITTSIPLEVSLKIRVPAIFKYEPVQDITLYELALVLPIAATLLYCSRAIEGFINQLPDCGRRHFKEICE